MLSGTRPTLTVLYFIVSVNYAMCMCLCMGMCAVWVCVCGTLQQSNYTPLETFLSRRVETGCLGYTINSTHTSVQH